MEGIGYLLLLSSVLLSSSLASPLEKRSVFGPKCYDMTSGFCGSIGYSKTSICTADHAVLESVLQSFQPLVASGCAEELKPFLCFAHLPICIKSEEPAEPNTIVKPCRSMCERVESKCGLLLKAVGLSWPESLDCTQYSDKKCASFPTSSPTPPPKCERCTVKRKSSLGLNKMCKKGSESDNVIYAQMKVLSRTVSGDARTVFYNVQVTETYTNNAKVKVSQDTSIWVISSSTDHCDCHQLKANRTYIAGLTVQSTYGKPFYTLEDDAVVMAYKDTPRFMAKLEKCT